MRHIVDRCVQGALVAPVRQFEHHPGPRLTLKVVHGDEAIDRLNLRDQRRESFLQPAFHPGPDAVLDDAYDHCALLALSSKKAYHFWPQFVGNKARILTSLRITEEAVLMRRYIKPTRG